jgi:hypothetical protein
VLMTSLVRALPLAGSRAGALPQAREFARRTGNTDNATWAPYALELTLGGESGFDLARRLAGLRG